MSLPTTKATTATGTHAVVQAVETYIQNQNLLGEIAELDELLYDLIDLHKDNELALKRVVQCIYNLLQSNSKWNVKFGSKVFHKLISVVIADSNDDDGCPHGQRRQLVANVLICVQIHARKFPRIDGKFLLRQLWSLSLRSERQPHAAQILVQLFDDFVRELGMECACSTELYAVIQTLLQSEVREYRKSAHFLMKKLLMIMQTDKVDNGKLSSCVRDALKSSEPGWSAYVVIMETLEEQQSHLILPTLSTLLPRILSSNQDNEWLTWLRILYARLLQDNNILVLRWTINYFFTHFDVAKLYSLNLLTEFLAATNRTQLYNVDYNFLPGVDMQKFMSPSSEQVFLNALVNVPWHSVPLSFWLRNMQPEKGALTHKKLLLKLCSRIRTMRNSELRQSANKRLLELFDETIKSLTLGDFIVLIESLFKICDCVFWGREILIRKLAECENIGEEFVHFNKRCYDIFFPSYCSDSVVEEILKHLNKLPKSRHGWWRLFLLFIFNDMDPKQKRICTVFYSNEYNINTEIFKKGADLEEVQQHLLQQLNCQTKDEKSFVLEHCVDLFVQVNLKSWSQFDELNLQPIDLLERGTKATFVHLVQLLKDVDTRLEDNANVIAAFVNLLKKHPKCELAVVGILQYAAKHLSDAENENIFADISSNCNKWTTSSILRNAKALPNSLIVQGILDGEIRTGDARIEAAYFDSIFCNAIYDDVALRNEWIYFVSNQPDARVSTICAELLGINKELTEKKPRYFENCKEHRIKIRIARALLNMMYKIKWSDELWTAVLAPNDQLNISYMYEYLVAHLLPSLDPLLHRLQSLGSLKPSQQVSIISVVHIYCMCNWISLGLQHLQEIMSLLLPHTMGAHFQTRLLAQLVLHRLAVKCEESSIELPILNALKSSIERTLGDKLNELQNETRLLLPAVISNRKPADIILHMTNTPFDEYNKCSIYDELKTSIEISRATFKGRKTASAAVTPMLVNPENVNVQRKINPVNDIYHVHDFAEAEEQLPVNELIVVASLVDKLPNLGGLARTCEVLGVKTMILGAKCLADKSDFTNLSMTAEKTLNIVEVKPEALGEFLIEKQSMGYKIVGAEQTAHSISFKDFKFPDKCILLLGHEKHGIPVDLIALLDYAVEIPQFGVVRSLNVHVTGSLFIWEYCKQHFKK